MMDRQYFNTIPEERQRFDSSVQERRILDVVQPLFATNLPWKLEADSDHGNGLAEQINAQTAKEMFLHELVTAGLYLRELKSALSVRSFRLCLETSSDLLAFLETLVCNDILGQPRPGDTSGADNTPGIHKDKPPENEPAQVVGVPLVLDLVAKWLFQIPEPKPIALGRTEQPTVRPHDDIGALQDLCDVKKISKTRNAWKNFLGVRRQGLPQAYQFPPEDGQLPGGGTQGLASQQMSRKPQEDCTN